MSLTSRRDAQQGSTPALDATGELPVPPARRRYRSPLREQQVASTRAAVVDAAGRLFADHGWAGTGMREVARQAGVSVETVYAHFGSKGDLLMAAVDQAAVGDAEPVPLRARPEFEALGRGTRQQRTRAAAALISTINQRIAGVHLALREASRAEPDLAERLEDGERRRRMDVEQAAALIVGRPVSPIVADGLWAVVGVEVFELLTRLRGWAPDQYQAWLADVIDRLLAEAPAPHDSK